MHISDKGLLIVHHSRIWYGTNISTYSSSVLMTVCCISPRISWSITMCIILGQYPQVATKHVIHGLRHNSCNIQFQRTIKPALLTCAYAKPLYLLLLWCYHHDVVKIVIFYIQTLTETLFYQRKVVRDSNKCWLLQQHLQALSCFFDPVKHFTLWPCFVEICVIPTFRLFKDCNSCN